MFSFLPDTYLFILLHLLLMIMCSTFIWTGLLVTNQTWVRTFSQTTTIFALPLITYSITNVISGNIALSLGMVGALSIVRFRNPVRSPLELVIYFLCITIGIVTYANYKFAFVLIFSFLILGLLGFIAKAILLKFLNIELFKSSFVEANQKYMLNINSSKEINELLNDSCLVSLSNNNKEYNYILADEKKEKIIAMYEKFKKYPDVKTINFTS